MKCLKNLYHPLECRACLSFIWDILMILKMYTSENVVKKQFLTPCKRSSINHVVKILGIFDLPSSLRGHFYFNKSGHLATPLNMVYVHVTT